MLDSQILIRHATAEDIPALGALARGLALQHHGYDPHRFSLLPAEADYADYFAEQLGREDVVIFVAEVEGRVAGYVFGRIELPIIESLLDTSGWVHDIFLDETARGRGAGKALLDAALGALQKSGACHLMLSVAPQNESAKRLFESRGFRVTMLEMTLAELNN